MEFEQVQINVIMTDYTTTFLYIPTTVEVAKNMNYSR